MQLDIFLNVAVGGILTGLVYGLMALGLSVIFGVVRVVNFAHGEMMTMAMYAAVTLFAAFHLDPLVMMIPIAATMFALGYLLQVGLINSFITRPEHSQFLLINRDRDHHRQRITDRVRAGRAKRPGGVRLSTASRLAR